MTDPASVPQVSDERLDEVFSVLADRHRRYVLHYFLETQDDVASVDALAVHVADIGDVDDPDRVPVVLHHQHLPKLEDVGVLEYDTRSSTVRYRGDPLVSRHFRLLAVAEDEG